MTLKTGLTSSSAETSAPVSTPARRRSSSSNKLKPRIEAVAAEPEQERAFHPPVRLHHPPQRPQAVGRPQ